MYNDKYQSIPFEDERISSLSPSELRADSDALMQTASYAPAFQDRDYLTSPAARPIRIQSELMKPDWYLQKYGIRSTIIVFGSARFIDRETALSQLQHADTPAAKIAVKMSEYYEFAREFGYLVSKINRLEEKLDSDGILDYVICTGGGPGIMEAANRGAYEAGALTVGLNIQLPYEQRPNPYISPQLCFNFHYFAIRKLHFLLRAKALVVCPGGFGTMDELFETLTLRQTERMQAIPILLYGKEFWEKAINFDYLVETGVIARKDLELFHYVETPQEAWEMIKAFHRE